MNKPWLRQSEVRSAATPPALSYKEGKGHLSVNPVYGCGVGCPYCFNLADAAGGARRELATVPELVDALERKASLVRRLRLSLLDFCDPFEPRVAPHLRGLLEGIATRLPQQVVLLTTRLLAPAVTLDWIASLPLRVSVFVSVGDATGAVRPVTSVERRLSMLRECRACGLHTVLLLRPLVREWTERTALRALLSSAAADEVVVAGLTRSPEIDASLEARGWPVPARATNEVDPSLLRDVLELTGEVLPGIPVSSHRSCAINRRWGLPCLVLRSSQVSGSDVTKPRLCRCWADVRMDAGASDEIRAGYCQLRTAA